MASKADVAEVMAVLHGEYGERFVPTESRLEVWHQLLGEWSRAEVQDACMAHLNDPKRCEHPPMPGQLTGWIRAQHQRAGMQRAKRRELERYPVKPAAELPPAPRAEIPAEFRELVAQIGRGDVSGKVRALDESSRERHAERVKRQAEALKRAEAG